MKEKKLSCFSHPLQIVCLVFKDTKAGVRRTVLSVLGHKRVITVIPYLALKKTTVLYAMGNVHDWPLKAYKKQFSPYHSKITHHPINLRRANLLVLKSTPAESGRLEPV